ncbi:MAG: GntR family transcriptional regulator [Acidobacteria bacterium]|nr:GntR family transcriptional regulator [Acidobacteriota bacterium]
MAKLIKQLPETDSVVDSQAPKYQKILLELKRAIVNREFKPGEKLPSEMQLAETFSTSRLTVARALKELQSQGLIDRRAGSGTYVREPDRAQGHVFGLLIPGLGETEIFEPICQGMARAGRAGRHALLWGDATHGAEPKEQQAKQLCEYYLSMDVSGVFFAPVELLPNMDEVNRWIIDAFERAGIPLILLDRDLYPYPLRSRFDLVGIDNRRAGYMVTDHVIQAGCRRIVFIARPRSASTVDARIAGYREALFANDLPVDRESVFRGDPSSQDWIGQIIESVNPDAFVCANDHTAGHLMHTLDALEVRVPDDIRIVGMDDVKYASLLRVPLTTLRQPCHDLGAAAISAMLERIAHPTMPARDILLDCKMIVRQSCGRGS